MDITTQSLNLLMCTNQKCRRRNTIQKIVNSLEQISTEYVEEKFKKKAGTSSKMEVCGHTSDMNHLINLLVICSNRNIFLSTNFSYRTIC